MRDSEITPESLFLGRRDWLQAAGMLALAAVDKEGVALADGASTPGLYGKLDFKKSVPTALDVTSEKNATTYNNFYEFGTGKEDPAKSAKSLIIKPWAISSSGLVTKPKTISLEELFKQISFEERVYRFRCVEGWSMVVPWIGFPLKLLIEKLSPLSSAKFVTFKTLKDPKQMPGQNSAVLDWPYVEGLRMDEAMHPLTLLVVGMYGKFLPNQNGAPLRLIVPWKYGFKSIKSIVSLEFSEKMPTTSWMSSAPQEYGFYANVNPKVDHPRWSQATERKLGSFFKAKTLMFNGYEDEVASLYRGMDLTKLF